MSAKILLKKSGYFRQAVSVLLIAGLLCPGLSPAFASPPAAQPTARVIPAVSLQGLQLYPDNPFKFDFIIDAGKNPDPGQVKVQSSRLIKYFLAGLTIPSQDIWVNLSPYEPEAVAPQGLSRTELGKDLLSQDYYLKQAAASLTDPQQTLGKKFWENIYAQVYQKYGTTNLPINTFNKVWILPDTAEIYEDGDKAIVAKAKLKVLVEEDYLAATQSNAGKTRINADKNKRLNDLSGQVLKEMIIPAIEDAVNNSREFDRVRQIYQALMLAEWFKRKLRDSLDSQNQNVLASVYLDQQKTAGVKADDPRIKEKIYQKYLAAFKQGAYDFSRSEKDAHSGKIVKRRYYSGGLQLDLSRSLQVSPRPEEYALNSSAMRRVSWEMFPLDRQGFPVVSSAMRGKASLILAAALAPVALGIGLDNKALKGRYLSEQDTLRNPDSTITVQRGLYDLSRDADSLSRDSAQADSWYRIGLMLKLRAERYAKNLAPQSRAQAEELYTEALFALEQAWKNRQRLSRYPSNNVLGDLAAVRARLGLDYADLLAQLTPEPNDTTAKDQDTTAKAVQAAGQGYLSEGESDSLLKQAQAAIDSGKTQVAAKKLAELIRRSPRYTADLEQALAKLLALNQNLPDSGKSGPDKESLALALFQTATHRANAGGCGQGAQGTNRDLLLQAEAAFQEALAMTADSGLKGQIYQQLWQVYKVLARIDGNRWETQAQWAYQQAVQIDSSYGFIIRDSTNATTVHTPLQQAGPWYESGQRYLAQGLYVEAVNDFERAIAKDQSFVEAYLAAAEVYRLLNQTSAAYYKFEQLGDYYVSQGNISQAIDAYTQALSQNNTNLDAYKPRGFLYWQIFQQKGDPVYRQKAIADWARFDQASPEFINELAATAQLGDQAAQISREVQTLAGQYAQKPGLPKRAASGMRQDKEIVVQRMTNLVLRRLRSESFQTAIKSCCHIWPINVSLPLWKALRSIEQMAKVNVEKLSWPDFLAYVEVEAMRGYQSINQFLGIKKLPLVGLRRVLNHKISRYLVEQEQTRDFIQALPDAPDFSQNTAQQLVDQFARAVTIRDIGEIKFYRLFYDYRRRIHFADVPEFAEVNSRSGQCQEFIRKHPEFAELLKACGILDLAKADQYLAKLKSYLRRQFDCRPEEAKQAFIRYAQASGRLSDYLGDWLLNLGVGGVEEQIKSTVSRFGGEAWMYGGTPYQVIKEIDAKLQLTSRDVFYDLGSGYGRTVFYTALTTAAGKVKGVELVAERAVRCDQVAKRLGLDKVEFINRDVKSLDFSDGTVFYMFNPFNRETLDVVMEKLQELAGKKTIRIAVLHGGPLEACDSARWLKPITGRGEFSSSDVMIFESTLAPAASAMAPDQVPLPFDPSRRAGLEKIDELNEIRRSQWSAEQRFNWLEHGLFYGFFLQRKRDAGGPNYNLLSESQKERYWQEYLAELPEIIRVSRSQVNSLDSPDRLFTQLQQARYWQNFIVNRAKVMFGDHLTNSVAAGEVDLNFLWRSGFDLARLRQAVVRYPELEGSARQSMIDFYPGLEQFAHQAETELSRRVQEDPGLAREIFRRFQQGTLEIFDPAIADWLLGIEEDKREPQIWQTANQYRGEQLVYQGTDYPRIRRVIGALNLGPSDVFYDLGAGYGRVALYTALASDVGKVKGVEMVPERASRGEQARQSLRLNNVEFIQAKAQDLDFSDGTVFYMFQPFSPDTFRAVMARVKKVAEQKPIRLVFYGSPLGSAYQSWLKATTLSDFVTLYQSTLTPAAIRASSPIENEPDLSVLKLLTSTHAAIREKAWDELTTEDLRHMKTEIIERANVALRSMDHGDLKYLCIRTGATVIQGYIQQVQDSLSQAVMSESEQKKLLTELIMLHREFRWFLEQIDETSWDLRMRSSGKVADVEGMMSAVDPVYDDGGDLDPVSRHARLEKALKGFLLGKKEQGKNIDADQRLAFMLLTVDALGMAFFDTKNVVWAILDNWHILREKVLSLRDVENVITMLERWEESLVRQHLIVTVLLSTYQDIFPLSRHDEVSKYLGLIDQRFSAMKAIACSRRNIACGKKGDKDYSIKALIKEACKDRDNVVVDDQIPENDHPYFKGDRLSLLNAVGNILDNAKTFAKVKVTLRRENKFIRTDIQDNGGGLPENLLEDDPRDFPRHDPISGQTRPRAKVFGLNVSTKDTGTGLGATEAWYAAHDLGGVISVSNVSEGVERGACFSIILPESSSAMGKDLVPGLGTIDLGGLPAVEERQARIRFPSTQQGRSDDAAYARIAFIARYIAQRLGNTQVKIQKIGKPKTASAGDIYQMRGLGLRDRDRIEIIVYAPTLGLAEAVKQVMVRFVGNKAVMRTGSRDYRAKGFDRIRDFWFNQVDALAAQYQSALGRAGGFAMQTDQPIKKGGIEFNADKLDLTIRGQANNFLFGDNFQLELDNFSGFSFRIRQIAPAKNF